MKVAQVASQLCASWLTKRNPADIPADSRLLLLSAITAGIGEYYSSVPVRFREKHWGARFAAPATGTISATAGATAVTVSGITPVDGCTVEIAGDGIKNTLLATAAGGWELAIPYGGATGSGKSLTVYRDTAVLQWTFSRFITNLRNASSDEELIPIDSGYEFRGTEQIRNGYRIEQAGQNQIVRALPLPAGDLPVKAVLELSGVSYGGIGILTNFDAPALPMPDDHVTRFVLPLVAAHLVTHPDWRDPGMANVAMNHAESARTNIRLLSPVTNSGRKYLVSSM